MECNTLSDIKAITENTTNGKDIKVITDRYFKPDNNTKQLMMYSGITQRKDFLSENEKGIYAGKHLIIDLIDAKNLDNLIIVENTLKECVKASQATLLHIHCHHFTPNGGISGVAVLSESHISIHSWPEIGYAALDIFMCGNTQPQNAVDVVRRAFEPKCINVEKLWRGQGSL